MCIRDRAGCHSAVHRRPAAAAHSVAEDGVQPAAAVIKGLVSVAAQLFPGTAQLGRADGDPVQRLFRQADLHLSLIHIFTSCYRYENPQAGRLREFHQFGVECFGAAAPQADAEVIALAHTVLETLGVTGVSLHINSIGCPACRAKYHEALKAYFSARKDQLCETCLGRLERNPMRILDCKSPVCSALAAEAPVILDYLCDDCAAHFQAVKGCLEEDVYKRQLLQINYLSREGGAAAGDYVATSGKGGIYPRGLLIGTIPVSYTHLDVYKRQTWALPLWCAGPRRSCPCTLPPSFPAIPPPGCGCWPPWASSGWCWPGR